MKQTIKIMKKYAIKLCERLQSNLVINSTEYIDLLIDLNVELTEWNSVPNTEINKLIKTDYNARCSYIKQLLYIAKQGIEIKHSDFIKYQNIDFDKVVII